jgi:putative ABC transport system permease protein
MIDGRVTTGLLSSVEIVALNQSPTVVERAVGVSAQPFDATLTRDDGTPLTVMLSGVTEGFFDVLGLPMSRGRAFTHDEHLVAGRDAPFAVILSDRAWLTLFGRDPDIVGKSIRMAEAPAAVTVVGVASPALDLPRGTDFWFNLRLAPDDVSHGFSGIVRVRPGVTVDRLRGAGAAAMAGLARTVPSDVGREYVMRPLVSSLVGDLGPTLLIVLGATGLLLVLACVNVTNLLLARGMARTREIAVRTALGASRGRVVGQLLTESMVLATGGALAGLLLAFVAIRLMLRLGASTLPRLETVPFDGRVLLFAVAVLLFSGLTMGVAPAFRLAGADSRTLLNASGRSTTSSGGTSRIMSSMIVAEIALAIALVAGAGWLVQSFARLHTIDPGFVADGRLVLDVRPARNFPQPAEAQAWSNEMLSRVRASAGGALVGSATTFPLRTDRDGTFNVELENQAPDPNRVNGAHIRVVTPGFFEAMGIKVLAGRTFSDDDREGTQRVVIVNRAFVRRFFPNTDPLAGSFAYGYPTVNRKTMSRIAGVVQDVRYKSLAEEAEPTYYLPQTQGFPIVRHVVVIAAPPGTANAVMASVRAELKRFDPHLLVSFSMAPQIVADTLGRQQLGMTLMLIFGATAVALAAIGIYGVIAYAATQRSGEIATRLALGASGRHVFWLMLGAAQRLAIGGLLLGLAIAYAGGRVVASSVFAMRAADPVVLTAAAAIVAAVTGLATIIPALRATGVDPVRALRSE